MNPIELTKHAGIFVFLLISLNAGAQSSDYIVYEKKFDSGLASLEITPDQKRLLVGDQEGNLHFIDLPDMELVNTFEGIVNAGILDIEVTPKQDVIFIANGSQIKLITPEGQPVINWNLHNTTIWSMDIDPLGKQLVSAEMNRTFQLWDIFTGEVVKNMEGHEEPALAVSFSQDGKYLASGSNDRQVFLWDMNTLEVISTFHGHSDHIYDVAFSPDGTLLAAASKDKSVRIWNIAEKKVMQVLKGHQDMVMEIEFSRDGRYLLSASADYSIRLWDVESGEQIYAFLENEAALLDVVFLPDGKSFASAGLDQYLKIRELNPEIFVLRYYGDAYAAAMKNDPLFNPRQKGEKRSAYEERMIMADQRKSEIVEEFYTRYLQERYPE